MKIDPVGVFVSDLRQSRKFYEEVLGLKFVEVNEDGFARMPQEVHLFNPKKQALAGIDQVSFRLAARTWAAADRTGTGAPGSSNSVIPKDGCGNS